MSEETKIDERLTVEHAAKRYAEALREYNEKLAAQNAATAACGRASEEADAARCWLLLVSSDPDRAKSDLEIRDRMERFASKERAR